MNLKIKKIIEELRQGLTALYGERLVKMVLFGSQARGDAEHGSDIDLIVVLKDPFDSRSEYNRIDDLVYNLSYENDEVISCLLMDQPRFETEKSPLLLNIRREGFSL